MDINEKDMTIEEASLLKRTTGKGRKAVARVIEEVCTGCKICVPVCPSKCIAIVDSDLNYTGIASVSHACTGCNICAIDCPWKAIVMIYPDGSQRGPAEYERQLKKLRGYL
ncbi:MAG: 4Fe-4S dicluster domain-containing protein [Chlorobiaceae bacterium]|jgi:Pyruvate/2-oxoacid:ferredoxin oxidoreductase delta subunit|nr:4Fe-4S dicluster domain-containing protein [Chlorobiaceae bacterium]NTW63601.1 4Fe-4S dicluster domain-containing protein [Chlorobiaceae bacterium]